MASFDFLKNLGISDGNYEIIVIRGGNTKNQTIPQVSTDVLGRSSHDAQSNDRKDISDKPKFYIDSKPSHMRDEDEESGEIIEYDETKYNRANKRYFDEIYYPSTPTHNEMSDQSDIERQYKRARYEEKESYERIRPYINPQDIYCTLCKISGHNYTKCISKCGRKRCLDKSDKHFKNNCPYDLPCVVCTSYKHDAFSCEEKCTSKYCNFYIKYHNKTHKKRFFF